MNETVIDLPVPADAVKPALNPTVVIAVVAAGVITAGAVVGVRKWVKSRKNRDEEAEVVDLRPAN